MAEYCNATQSGAVIKMPFSKKGLVFNVSKYQVAEFPLLINKRPVYISEQLAGARCMVAGIL